jgi:hypothetical protein
MFKIHQLFDSDGSCMPLCVLATPRSQLESHRNGINNIWFFFSWVLRTHTGPVLNSFKGLFHRSQLESHRNGINNIWFFFSWVLRTHTGPVLNSFKGLFHFATCFVRPHFSLIARIRDRFANFDKLEIKSYSIILLTIQ